jgi:hypothetical protein
MRYAAHASTNWAKLGHLGTRSFLGVSPTIRPLAEVPTSIPAMPMEPSLLNARILGGEEMGNHDE